MFIGEAVVKLRSSGCGVDPVGTRRIRCGFGGMWTTLEAGADGKFDRNAVAVWCGHAQDHKEKLKRNNGDLREFRVDVKRKTA